MSDNIIQLNEDLIKHDLKDLVGSSMKEALIEMYLTGVSLYRVEDIMQALWDTKVSLGTISNLNKRLMRRQNRSMLYGEHTRVVRGNPVRIYEGEKFVLRKQQE